MSLINDALRRAKQAQKETPAPPVAPVPQLRPVEPLPQAARHGLGLMLPFSLAAIALLSLLLYWELSKRDGSSVTGQPGTALSVAAKGLPAASAPVDNLASGAPAANNSATVNSTAASNTLGRNGLEQMAAVKESAPGQAPLSAASSNGSNSLGAVADGGQTNHSAVTEPPAPAPLKLQSIVYNPRRPSAMISGRIVFVGERIHEYHVMAIHPDNVVLAAAGHTNLLSLEP
jgi:hypothetical protein